MTARDYDRVELAIRYLQTNWREQPSLEDVARRIGVSPPYLQRVFRRWAGVSPKTLLRLLTVEHAKRLLGESRSILDAAYESGLSGSGRLHDHFVTLEAITPGEYKHGGAGVEIAWGLSNSPFGPCFLAVTARGVCRLAFLGDSSGADELAALRKHGRSRQFAKTGAPRLRWGAASFRPADHSPPIPLLAKGTNFQVQVWRALLEIPEGAAATYQDIAAVIGRPTASRAVGQAVGDNPIAYLIPCHRVLRQSGDLGGYRWGTTRKTAILAWEAARRESAACEVS
jgi:AraC family transcriptional regulator, regulatory protein of adaptative response / methylated-DNA-[protein]-cysteine methyltransferase